MNQTHNFKTHSATQTFAQQGVRNLLNDFNWMPGYCSLFCACSYTHVRSVVKSSVDVCNPVCCGSGSCLCTLAPMRHMSLTRWDCIISASRRAWVGVLMKDGMLSGGRGGRDPAGTCSISVKMTNKKLVSLKIASILMPCYNALLFPHSVLWLVLTLVWESAAYLA